MENKKTYADGILIISSAENVTTQNNTIHNIYNITFGEGIVLYTLNGPINVINSKKETESVI